MTVYGDLTYAVEVSMALISSRTRLYSYLPGWSEIYTSLLTTLSTLPIIPIIEHLQ